MQTLHDNGQANAGSEQSIMDAAETLFAEKGFDAVSMSAIAKLANTSKPNIYHHFKNKKDLYLAVIKTAARHSSSLLDALAEAPGSLQNKLSRFSAGQLGNILAHKRRTQLILREALSGGTDRGRDIAKHVVGEGFSRLVAMIREGQHRNEFRREVDPALAAFMIVASNVFFFQGAAVMQHIPDINFTNDADQYCNGVMDLFFKGILQEGETQS